MTQIKIFKSDKLYDISFTLQDANGAAFDLTGYSQVLFKAQKQGAATIKFSGTMTVISPSAGTCKYNVAATDFDEAGQYYAEIEATFGSGKVVTFGDIVVIVQHELPR